MKLLLTHAGVSCFELETLEEAIEDNRLGMTDVDSWFGHIEATFISLRNADGSHRNTTAFRANHTWTRVPRNIRFGAADQECLSILREQRGITSNPSVENAFFDIPLLGLQSLISSARCAGSTTIAFDQAIPSIWAWRSNTALLAAQEMLDLSDPDVPKPDDILWVLGAMSMLEQYETGRKQFDLNKVGRAGISPLDLFSGSSLSNFPSAIEMLRQDVAALDRLLHRAVEDGQTTVSRGLRLDSPGNPRLGRAVEILRSVDLLSEKSILGLKDDRLLRIVRGLYYDLNIKGGGGPASLSEYEVDAIVEDDAAPKPEAITHDDEPGF